MGELSKKDKKRLKKTLNKLDATFGGWNEALGRRNDILGKWINSMHHDIKWLGRFVITITAIFLVWAIYNVARTVEILNQLN